MQFPHFKSSKWRFHFVILVIIALVGIILISWLPAHNIDENRKIQDVEEQINASTNQLHTTLELYIQTLYGARGLMAASQNVFRGEWLHYYQNIGVTKRLPGLAVLGYIKSVPASEKAAFTAQMNNDASYPTEVPLNFTIHPDTQFGDLQVITYMEPMSALIRQNSLGFDYNSDPIRRALLEKARDNNQPILSPPITTLDTKQSALVLLLPVYNPLLPHVDIEQRRKAYTGAIVLGFRSNEFFQQAFHDLEQQNLSVDVFDGDSLDDQNLIYRGTPESTVLGASTERVAPTVKDGVVTSIRKVNVADRVWTLRYQYPVPKEPMYIIPTLTGRLAMVALTNILTGLAIYHYLRLKKR